MKKYLILLIGFIVLGMFVSELYAGKKNKDYVKVVYFHGDRRCFTCNKMEKLIHNIVKDNFKNEVENGKVEIMSINFDKETNEHYAKDYNLFSQTLIISIFKNGKETKWKNADKVWELIRDDAKFSEYISSEVKESLKEL